MISDWTHTGVKHHFLNLEDTLTSTGFSTNTSQERVFSVQLGRSLWEGEDSIIIMMNDVSSVKDYYKAINKHKDEFLATISHELKTPLNGLLGAMENIVEEIEEDHPMAENFEIMTVSGKLLLNKINELLDSALIANGKLKLNIQDVKVVELANDVLATLKFQKIIEGKKLKFINELSFEKEVIRTDGVRLKQILINLLGIAIKIFRKEFIHLRVWEKIEEYDFDKENPKYSLASIEEENISLISKGVGKRSVKAVIFEISEAESENDSEIEMSFAPKASENNDASSFSGSLPSFAISKGLVQFMNNFKRGCDLIFECDRLRKFYFPILLENEEKIDLMNEKIQGSTKVPSFFLTKTFIASDSKKRDPSDAELLHKFRKTKETIKVLIVDDDLINQLVACNFLSSGSEDFEFTYQTACNGKEAIDIFNANILSGKPFQIILMDCNMPVLDGFQASKLLKSKMTELKIPFAPIIAVTANVGSADKAKCLEFGMDFFLSKPYTRQDLHEMIKKALIKK